MTVASDYRELGDDVVARDRRFPRTVALLHAISGPTMHAFRKLGRKHPDYIDWLQASDAILDQYDETEDIPAEIAADMLLLIQGGIR